MEEYPLFTVIIPQKNRAEYLIHTLRTCMVQDYPNFQVIVSDDCSEDDSVEMVRKLAKQDSRIKLFAHDHHLGMRDNFEFALNQVKSGYVMALGGDDGLCPGSISRMYSIIKETGTPLLTWQLPTFFYSDRMGVCRMSVRKERTKGYKWIKSSDYLNKIANTLNYLVDDCPMFYIKGVVSIDLVNRVKTRTPDGCFYYCPTPDGFSGVVLAGEVEQYVYTDEPLSINGATIKSQGFSYMQSDKKSKEASQEFFRDSSRKTMHAELASQPYSPLLTLMTADYLLTARDLPGWPGKFTMCSIEHIIEKSFDFIANTDYAKDTIEREVSIIREIAKQHSDIELFDKLLKTTKKKTPQKIQLDGLVVTRSVISFNATKLGINNVFDASMAMPFAYRMSNSITMKEFNCFLKSMFKQGMTKFHRKSEPLSEIIDNL